MEGNEIRLYRHELESMPEYSTSIPSGTVLFKMWRRALYADPPQGPFDFLQGTVIGWYVGQFAPLYGEVIIRWFNVVLREGPAPMIYHPPDWHNTQRYKRLGLGR